MATDLENEPLDALLSQFREMAHSRDDWRELLSKVDPDEALTHRDVLVTLKALSEAQDVWDLALSCAAYSIYKQRMNNESTEHSGMSVVEVAQALHAAPDKVKGFQEVAESVCGESHSQVVHSARHLTDILKNIPIAPPINYLPPNYCRKNYGYDSEAFMDCLRR